MFCSFISFSIVSCPVDFMFRGKKVRVKGRFPLKNPWWEISCSAQQYSRKTVASGYPSYKLRTDDWRTLMSVFLKECDVNPLFVNRFMEWLPKDRYVGLINIEEALHEFGESNDAREEAKYFNSVISNSGISSMLLKSSFSSAVLYFLRCNFVCKVFLLSFDHNNLQ